MIKLFFSLFLFFTGYSTMAQNNNPGNFPVPPSNVYMLFYVQRSLNKNTIIYELNRLPEGKVNTDKPVNIYWIRYEEGGKKEELTSIQMFAYGLSHRQINADSGIIVINFKRDKSRDIYLKKDSASSFYRAHINIKGEESYLHRIFIQLKNSFFSFKPEIAYIDIYGVSVKTNKLIIERYLP